MFEITADILAEAEAAARENQDFASILTILRRLPFEDFGLLFIGMPDPAYPRLSRILPPMASAEVQKNWTGAAGLDLYRQTSAFARIVQANYAHYRQRSLSGRTIMDFGCGYGRILRMLYYFSPPDLLWGLDAWQRSLNLCTEARLPGHFRLSEEVPTTLPVGEVKFDLIVSFSVFTHLAPAAAQACLSALRKHVADDGLLMLTIRPIEFWRYIDSVRQTRHADELERQHREKGVAYLPHMGAEGQTYGDISYTQGFFETEDWHCVGLDRSVSDPFQVTCILEPR